MKTIIHLLGLLLFISMTMACNFNDDDVNIPMLPRGTIDFGGFIETDGDGEVVEGVDPNDWRLDVIFNRDELTLYPSGLAPLCSGTDGTQIAPAFPNPFQDTLSLRITQPKNGAMDLVVVDRNYEPQLFFNPILLGTDSVVNFTLDMRALPSGLDSLRLYYVIGRGSCTLRGYGDLLRE